MPPLTFTASGLPVFGSYGVNALGVAIPRVLSVRFALMNTDQRSYTQVKLWRWHLGDSPVFDGRGVLILAVVTSVAAVYDRRQSNRYPLEIPGPSTTDPIRNSILKVRVQVPKSCGRTRSSSPRDAGTGRGPRRGVSPSFVVT